jgi:hypothetical protein
MAFRPDATQRTDAGQPADAAALHRQRGDSEGRRLVLPFGDMRVHEGACFGDEEITRSDPKADATAIAFAHPGFGGSPDRFTALLHVPWVR